MKHCKKCQALLTNEGHPCVHCGWRPRITGNEKNRYALSKDAKGIPIIDIKTYQKDFQEFQPVNRNGGSVWSPFWNGNVKKTAERIREECYALAQTGVTVLVGVEHREVLPRYTPKVPSRSYAFNLNPEQRERLDVKYFDELKSDRAREV